MHNVSAYSYDDKINCNARENFFTKPLCTPTQAIISGRDELELGPTGGGGAVHLSGMEIYEM